MSKKHTIEDELNRTGRLLQTTVGDSMEPMLKNRENIVVLEKTDGILKKYDLPLYRRPNGKYVLHRIIKVRKNDYIICGDNRWKKEKVPHDWVLACVSGYYKNGRFISVDNPKYQKYLKTLGIRRKKIFIKAVIKRIKRVIS
ncbi:MAG: S24/S26 family peptidase [Ruminococcus sp.]|nr:S24/S26 family peptidase [Ruminococcus sp.]MDE6798380.1 S24/S26 family peptidase [Ruminococcus sp.]